MRYLVITGSESGHCCFEATIIDTTIKSRIENIVCECLSVTHANKICDALNEMNEEVIMLRENDQYLHRKTGNTYTVLMIANEHAEGWPVQVVYEGINGRVWARPLAEFLEKFTPLQETHNHDK